MKLRDVLEQINLPHVRPGQMVSSGITWQPDITAFSFIVAPRFHIELAATLRFCARPTRTAVKIMGNTAIVLVGTKQRDEAAIIVVAAALWLTGYGGDVKEIPEMYSPQQFDDFFRHPARWPSILKKLARG